ncbi:MAG: hypothetical protein WC139_05325 [Candidatus Kapaibacterium sp.]
MITKEKRNERLKLFEEACKNGSYDKWIAKAKKTIKGYYWTIDTDGLEIEIVNNLVVKIIDGERTKDWDLKEPKLDQIMYMDIRGDIYNLHQKEIRKVENGEEGDVETSSGAVMNEIYSSTREEVDMAYENKEILEIVEKTMEGDEVCKEIYTGIISNDFDLKDDKIIAKKLKRDITVIRAAKKRYKIRLDKATAKINNIKI